MGTPPTETMRRPEGRSNEEALLRHEGDTDMTHSSIIRSSVRRAALGLTAAALLLGTACDTEGEFDLEAQAELEDAADAPGLAHAAATDLVADVDAPVTAATTVHEYVGVHGSGSIADGDVVMIKNWWRGYLGCAADGDGTVGTSNPSELDSYAWLVHRTDIDGDGTDELQFEQVDGAGGTGIYLKMNGEGEVFCDIITGIGDAAAWNTGGLFVSTGFYKRAARQLINFKHDLCLQIDGNDEGASATCNGFMHKLFTFEIIAPA
ncbi:hypothetical protein [Paraliomyxa miuraensis]|uniref:hypothetical protein n=1 Tax=Paraliomyxa miuraensis TaxID=376150 RepID=UPI0022542E16|nr:hypothetical protein [Paraliomyxa miuraensis]MCX4247990.1 hypothetical protein [Paraliomyxa miuraensis]